MDSNKCTEFNLKKTYPHQQSTFTQNHKGNCTSQNAIISPSILTMGSCTTTSNTSPSNESASGPSSNPADLLEISSPSSTTSLKFKHKHCGKFLQFDSITKTIKMTNDSPHTWSSCLLCDYPISQQICDRFTIEFIWTKRARGGFVMGYLCNPSDSLLHSLDYNNWWGHGGLDQYSVGFWIKGTCKSFCVYDKDVKDKWNGFDCQGTADRNFHMGDTFSMTFDFIASKVLLGHNGQILEELDMKATSIMPGISLGFKEESVQITKWDMKKQQKLMNTNDGGNEGVEGNGALKSHVEDEVMMHLREIGFADVFVQQYYQLLIDQGFDTLQLIRTLTDDDLKEIGILKLGHRRKILMDNDPSEGVTSR